MQPNFTPEDWRAFASGAPGYPVTVGYMEGAEEVTVCDVTEQGARWSRMIAAAPDMFRALSSLAVSLRALGFGDDEEISGADTVDAVAEAFADIEAALAKAGGRS